MATCQEGCLGYHQEESPECEGWCEVCGVCYDEGYCTIERHFNDCDECHQSHRTEDHYAVVMAAKVQDMCLMKSVFANAADKCEVCYGDHKTWKCCDKCNYDNHMCHFCGDPLGHDEVSACYILEGLGIE